MQINAIQSNRNNAQPAFTAVKILSGAEEALRRTLKTEEDVALFNDIVEYRGFDKYADLYLFGNGKKLTARIINKQDSTEGILEQISQKFWQSTTSFLEKINRKTADAESLLEKKAQTQKKFDDVIKKTDKI